MEKFHVSSIIKIKKPNHSKFNFVDVNLLKDQKLFIDPILLSLNNDKWCKSAIDIIDKFFESLYRAYREDNYYMKKRLLSHAKEVNYTKLGYGNGRNGHGKTQDGLVDTFRGLEDLVEKIHNISNVIDLPILIKGFNEDGLSDLITNIIHKQLNDYTLEQLKSYGIRANSTDSFYTWDTKSSSWINIKEPCYKYEDMKILLTPKRIVRKNYLFSADQYLKRVILERQKKEHAYINEKGKEKYAVSKKELYNKLDKDTEDWKYNFIYQKTMEDESYLDEYHNVIKGFYIGRGMDDDSLDKLIY
ncbi:hypothetical protein PV797_10895 [Clostridiaceae bacterium M8S5]|nr:hypothetical protein PV797_10895 [Clostridiaceae bacterium M8S5]